MLKRIILWTLLVILLLILGGGWFVAGTQPGLRWVVAQLENLIPGTLSVQTVTGRLIGPFQIQGLRYSDDGTHVELSRIAADWHPLKLLQATLDISFLDADGLHVQQRKSSKPPASSKTGGQRFKLPVAVEIERLELKDLSYGSDGGSPVRITHASMGLNVTQRAVNVASLEVQAPEATLRANGDIGLAAGVEGQLDTQWEIRAPKFAPIQGHGSFSGNLAQLQLKQIVDSPYSSTISAQAELLGPTVPWQLTLDINDWELKKIDAQSPAATVSGHFVGSGTTSTLKLNGDARVIEPAVGSWQGDVEVAWDGNRWELPSFALRQTDGPGRLKLHGRWQPGQGQTAAESLDLQARWQHLTWPLVGTPEVISEDGTLKAEGSLTRVQFGLTAAIATSTIPTSRWTIDGNGDRSGLHFSSIDGKLLDGAWNGSGDLRWDPVVSMQATVSADAVNPGVAWPDWPGKLSAAFDVTAKRSNGQLIAAAQVTRLSGRLRGYPVDAKVRVKLAGDRVDVPELYIRSGSAQLAASAKIDRVWHAQWTLSAPDLSEVLPRSRGAITSRGELNGPLDGLNVQAEVTARNVDRQGLTLQSLDTKINMDLRPGGRWKIGAIANEAKWNETVLQNVKLDLSGNAQDNRLTLQAEGPQQKILLTAQGQYQERTWKGTLQGGRFRWEPLGEWVQQAPTGLKISADSGQLDQVCLQQAQARLCAQVAWNGANANGSLVLSDVSVARFDEWLPWPGTTITGDANGSGQFAYQNGRVKDARLDVAVTNGEVRYPLTSGQSRTTAYRDLKLKLNADQQGFEGTVQLALPSGGSASGVVRLPGWHLKGAPQPSQPVSGSLDIALDDLSLVPVVMPDVQEPKGKFGLQLAVSGTVGAPRLKGEGQLINGSAEIPRLGLKLKKLSLDLRTERGDTLLFDAKAESGPGALSVSGRVVLATQGGWRTEVQIKGDNVQVAHIPQADVLASPDLTIKVSPRLIQLGGKVTIPKADIHLPKPSNVQEVSPDVVVVGAKEQAESERRWRVSGTIQVIFGDKVQVQGYGFKGNIAGNIRVTEGESNVTTAQGELQVVNGQYKAYGQDLTIKRGRLLFAGGPVDNPALDITAVRQTNDVEAGVKVSGTVKAPQLTLFSNPAMDQGDVLSYLVLGRPLNQASSSEGASLYKAAAALGAAGGNKLTSFLAQKFGLQELSVETGATPQEASLVLGTYLAPKVYVRYVQDLANQTATIRIRYELSRRWTLETESSATGAGVDILFNIER